MSYARDFKRLSMLKRKVSRPVLSCISWEYQQELMQDAVRLGPFSLGWNWSFQGMILIQFHEGCFFGARPGVVLSMPMNRLPSMPSDLQGLYGFIVRDYNYDCIWPIGAPFVLP